MPKVSVVVPVYKVENYLKRCVDSILRQTFCDFELILVDDGSPDESGNICDNYASKDCRIQVIHKQNGGLSSARNCAIDWMFANSDSEWITFIDSDDWIHKDYLKILMTSALSTDTDISICKFIRVANFDNNKINSEIKEKIIVCNSEKFFKEHNVEATIACAKLYKRDFFSSVRYPEGKLHEDEFTTYKILFQCTDICFVNEELYYYFINTESITSGNSSDIWKPEKMIFNEAVEERLEYFKERNMSDTYLWQLEHYMYFLCDSCKYIIESGNGDYKRKYLSDTRKKLRKVIKQIEKLKGKSLDKNKIWVKQTAYPREMAVYWFFKGIAGRFSK